MTRLAWNGGGSCGAVKTSRLGVGEECAYERVGLLDLPLRRRLLAPSSQPPPRLSVQEDRITVRGCSQAGLHQRYRPKADFDKRQFYIELYITKD